MFFKTGGYQTCLKPCIKIQEAWKHAYNNTEVVLHAKYQLANTPRLHIEGKSTVKKGPEGNWTCESLDWRIKIPVPTFRFVCYTSIELKTCKVSPEWQIHLSQNSTSPWRISELGQKEATEVIWLLDHHWKYVCRNLWQCL